MTAEEHGARGGRQCVSVRQSRGYYCQATPPPEKVLSSRGNEEKRGVGEDRSEKRQDESSLLRGANDCVDGGFLAFLGRDAWDAEVVASLHEYDRKIASSISVQSRRSTGGPGFFVEADQEL